LASLKKLNGLLLCLLIGLLMTACGGGGGDGTSGQVGTVSLSLTDNSALYNSVVLSIEKVGVVTNKSATTYYNSATISELPLPIDVLDLPGSATQFWEISRSPYQMMVLRSVSTRFDWFSPRMVIMSLKKATRI